ncbi:MAG: hypothetical protein IPQ07_12760 [Myxococcales bacterium]|nr:hypothetical protein [Myxococcales bacterium]
MAGKLGDAFNVMLDKLEETPPADQYLQRMGVWQDVARRPHARDQAR